MLGLLLLGTPVLAQSSQGGLTPMALWEMGRLGDEQVSPDGKTILYGVTHYDIKENKGNRDLYLLPVGGGEPVQITETPGGEYNARWRPDGQKIGYLSATSGSMQLWEMNTDGTGAVQVTNIEGGIDNFAYSPKGNYISFTRQIEMPAGPEAEYADLDKAEFRIMDDLMYRHWDGWEDNARTHPHYMAYENGAVKGDPVDIMKGEPFDAPLKPFGGLEEITWSNDETAIIYVCKKKQGKEWAVSTNSDLYQYELGSGVTTNLTEGMMGYDNQPAFSPDGRTLAWLSMARDGYESDRNVLYMMDMVTREKTAVTDFLDESVTGFIWGEQSKKVYLISGKQATYQYFELSLPKSLGKSEIKSNSLRQITSGMHDYLSMTQVGKQLIGAKRSMSMANELFAVDIATGKETQLTFENRETYEKHAMGKVEKRMVTTSDNKEMLVWVIYPPDFDPAKKYPALLYCQGGPQAAVSQFFSYRWNFQLMAAQGYIVVAPNRRGLPSFGSEWNEQISGDWGGQAMKDYLAAIDDVSKEDFVDEERLGAVGASYGGYSVYYLAGIHNKRFKTFISHCGLFNLESWYGTTEELFFANFDIKGAYWEEPKPKSYEMFSPHKLVANWDTPIMVIHGGQDFRVPESEGMQAFQAAQLKGLPSRFLYFPNEGHWVLSPQNGLVWHSEFFNWLDRFLKK